jgi:meso-butanediol dehydrogenase/(S,S)-butanediol dehydrogenase/diacetyl reductase
MPRNEEHHRSAMVTGAARGIGRAIAVRLAADGLAVSVADLPSAEEAVHTLAADLTRAGAACLPLAVDVTDADAVDAAVAAHDGRSAASMSWSPTPASR